jgi:hypothetical protein
VSEGDLKKREVSAEGIGRTRGEIIGKLHAQLTMVMMENKQYAAWLTPVVNGLCPRVRVTRIERVSAKVL